MKDYSKMSDQDINKAVEKATGMYCIDWEGRYIPTCDYCNNPSDAWSIIIANKIRVSPVMHMSDNNGEYLCTGEWEAGTLWGEDGAFYNSKYHFFSDENPLRAAMIVYLMMMDEEK